MRNGQTIHAPRWGALLLATTMLGGVSPALAQDEESGVGEIIVTAQKRAQNMQDVPVSLLAISEERIEELNISDFADYAKYLPSLSYSATYGPGYNRPFMRGIASGENGNHSGSMPSVGTYLDEQPITTITGNLDLHLYDVARVEVLAGPQGTLYGASSQAGTVRIITNRANPRGFEAAYDVEGNFIEHGEFGGGVEGFVNIPLSDQVAVRLVAWAERQGGYIDNVEGTRLYPTSGVVDDNSDLAEDDYNDVDTIGFRASLGIDLNDNWTVTPQIMGQRQESNGIFAQQRSVGVFDGQSDLDELEVMHWFPEWNEDIWAQAALTLNGKISDFDVVFASAYLTREVDSNQDYADYGFFYDTYLGYGCYFTDNATPGACDGIGFPGDPINPAQQVEGRDSYERISTELRVSSPAEKPVRFIAGLFYQHSLHWIHQRYIMEGLRDAHEVTGWDDTIWLTEQVRTDKESAAFGEVSFDLFGGLTGTVGARLFKTENSLRGFFGFGDFFSNNYSAQGEIACFGPPFQGAPCTNLEKTTSESGALYRANLQWNIVDDVMLYATYSEGFRPGGINRRGTLPPYEADFLKNYEFGWKSDWADGRFRLNGAIFFEQWEDFQFAFLGANGLTEIQNAGDAEIAGVEVDFAMAPVDGLTIYGSATLLESELTNAVIPGSVAGSQLPVAPTEKANVNARYEFAVGSWDAFVQGGVAYQGGTTLDLRQAEAALIGTLPSFTLVDLSTGVERNGYRFALFVENLLDERAVTARYAECAIGTCFGEQYEVVALPRTYGVRFGRRF